MKTQSAPEAKPTFPTKTMDQLATDNRLFFPTIALELLALTECIRETIETPAFNNLAADLILAGAVALLTSRRREKSRELSN